MAEEDDILPVSDSGSSDGPVSSWFCKHLKHDECSEKGGIAFHFRGQVPGPHPTRCQCPCHKQKRSPKHDWTEYDDELELERAIAEVPPNWLVHAASTKNFLKGKDAAWHYMGEWDSRSATARYGRVVCLRCAPDVRTIAGTGVRVYCAEYQDPATGTIARAGRCFVCGYIYWFRITP